MPTVLVIDDNRSVALALGVLLSLHEIDCVSALTPEQGLSLLAQRPIDLVIQDMNFSSDTTSGAEGVALFQQIRDAYPDLPVILLTAWTHLDAAARAARKIVEAVLESVMKRPPAQRPWLLNVNIPNRPDADQLPWVTTRLGRRHAS